MPTSRITRPRKVSAPRAARVTPALDRQLIASAIQLQPRPLRPVPNHPWFGMTSLELARRLLEPLMRRFRGASKINDTRA